MHPGQRDQFSVWRIDYCAPMQQRYSSVSSQCKPCAFGVPKVSQDFDRLCCESDDKVTVYHCCTRRTINGNYGPSLKENPLKDWNVSLPISICNNIESSRTIFTYTITIEYKFNFQMLGCIFKIPYFVSNNRICSSKSAFLTVFVLKIIQVIIEKFKKQFRNSFSFPATSV